MYSCPHIYSFCHSSGQGYSSAPLRWWFCSLQTSVACREMLLCKNEMLSWVQFPQGKAWNRDFSLWFISRVSWGERLWSKLRGGGGKLSMTLVSDEDRHPPDPLGKIWCASCVRVSATLSKGADLLYSVSVNYSLKSTHCGSQEWRSI